MHTCSNFFCSIFVFLLYHLAFSLLYSRRCCCCRWLTLLLVIHVSRYSTHSTHTHKTQCAWLLHFIILFAAFVCENSFHCPIFIVDFFPSSRYNYYVQCIYTCVCVCACACAGVSAYKLCSMVCSEQSYRWFYGAFCTQSHGVMCVPQEFRHYTCWLFYYIGFIFISTAFPELYMLHCLCELYA